MTTTTTFQGMDPGSKNSSRVLRPPGGGSNISFGTDEENPPARKNKMASSIFAEPEDPHAHRRNNPPGGKPTGVLCGEPSAPLRRCHAQPEGPSPSHCFVTVEICEEPEPVQELKDEVPLPSAHVDSAGGPANRRNPPGGKSSLILG
uniref:Jupiter microtubule associated homolog 1a n=1 Tax=Paramormyrops kingsleyae TaxID=1676925 RepID=A0A3B3RS23_9TELE